MSDRSFLKASVPHLVKQLTNEEKVRLLAGNGWWRTHPIPRLNIPSIKVSDGPNGARGETFFRPTPAVAAPNATCIAASGNLEDMEALAGLLAEETKARNAVCLLGPTVNIQRSPLGGRAFESFSEDPTLSGQFAAAYIKGLQKNGVSACIKHLVANDQEHERMGVNANISERALREVYLRPFQIAQKLAPPWAYMTAYNRLNGTHCSENKWLLQQILMKEFQHNGMIMSDWYGTYSVADSINAGVNLEMPGPTVWRQWHMVNHLMLAHKIDKRQVDEMVAGVLEWVQKLAKLNEKLTYETPSKERSRITERQSDAKLLRKVAGEGIVLLKNENDVLPVRSGRVALIGPSVKASIATGGGSAQLHASWTVTPWQGLNENKPDPVELVYAQGCVGAKFLPFLDSSFTSHGQPGFDVLHFPIAKGRQADSPLIVDRHHESELFLCDYIVDGLGEQYFTEVHCDYTAPFSGELEFGLIVTGQGWLWLDDTQVIANSENQIRGGPNSGFAGTATTEVRGRVHVEKGKQYKLMMRHDARPRPEVDTLYEHIVAVRIGARRVVEEEEQIRGAKALAQTCDRAIVFVGHSGDWESEGFDRDSLNLPKSQNRLISEVASVNGNTFVVVQAGSATAMPWIDEVAGVMYTWYGGNEYGNAMADIIYGTVNPSGRLPLTFPREVGDIPAHGNFKSSHGQVEYEEGIWVGYKWYNMRSIKPLYPFGHGLSYTSFKYSDLVVATSGQNPSDWSLSASVTVTNTGDRAGSHAVHCYTCPPPSTDTSLPHPSHSMQAIGKTRVLERGEAQMIQVTMDKCKSSYT